jgi:hypothetical protein
VSRVGAEAEASFACRRATYDTIAAAHPGTHVVGMADTVREAQDRHEESLFRDIVHLSDVGAAEVAAWLVPTVLAYARPTA